MSKRLNVEREALFLKMANNIQEYGRQILAIAGSNKEPPFAYTIGNQEKLLPELLLIGRFDPIVCRDLLNKLSEHMLGVKRKFNDGELITLPGGKFPVKVVDARDPIVKRNYTIQAGQFYNNEDYEVQQLVLPDPKGRYPDEPLCHKDFKVPVLKGGIILPADFKRSKS